jgi:hypothetical protein
MSSIRGVWLAVPPFARQEVFVRFEGGVSYTLNKKSFWPIGGAQHTRRMTARFAIMRPYVRGQRTANAVD